MPRLHKKSTVAFLALNAFFWTILATVYLHNKFYGSLTLSKLDSADLIDFRVIVLTFKRSKSLQKALRSIDAMEMDGDKAILEIWIDRSKSGLVDADTIEVAQSFNWSRGQTRVHIQKNHSGIRGQWIDTWKPTNDRELVVIVEDDLSLSRYAYRWIKAVHGFYGKREDFAGTSLTSDQVVSHHVSSVVPLKAPKNETVFMYSCVGSWGFSPKQTVWKRFQSWYHTHVNDTNFHPYVDGIRPTLWFKGFEKSGTSDSVWTQWFIYFSNMEKLFTIFNNLPTFVGDRKSCLSVNRREVGLHVRKKGREDLCKLLNRWDERFVRFTENITTLDWAGKNVREQGLKKYQLVDGLKRDRNTFSNRTSQSRKLSKQVPKKDSPHKQLKRDQRTFSNRTNQNRKLSTQLPKKDPTRNQLKQEQRTFSNRTSQNRKLSKQVPKQDPPHNQLKRDQRTFSNRMSQNRKFSKQVPKKDPTRNQLKRRDQRTFSNRMSQNRKLSKQVPKKDPTRNQLKRDQRTFSNRTTQSRKLSTQVPIAQERSTSQPVKTRLTKITNFGKNKTDET